MSNTKTCKSCNKIKSVSEFTKDSNTFDGIRTKCKVCQRKVNRKYYDKNSAQIIKRQKDRHKNKLSIERYGLTPDEISSLHNDGLKICYSCKRALDPTCFDELSVIAECRDCVESFCQEF